MTGRTETVAESGVLRVVHLIDSGGFFGAEQMIVTLASEQQKLGLDVTIATIIAPQDDDNPLGDAAEKAGLIVREFTMADGLNLSGQKEILDWLKAHSLDILHCHSYKANILMALARRTKCSWSFVTTLHGWTSVRHFTRHALIEFVERFLLFRFDAACFVSKAMLRRIPVPIRAQVNGKVVPNGINTMIREEALPKDIEEFASGRRIVIAVGRLSPEKDFAMLLRAMSRVLAEHSQSCLVIVGDGPERASLQAQMEHDSLEDSVMLAGYREHPRSWMSACHAFALSSRTEGLPMVLLEALLAGLPIVATSVGEVPAVVDGLKVDLVEPGDDLNFANALLTCLNEKQDDSAVRQRISRVASKYSGGAMADRYYEIYQSVLR